MTSDRLVAEARAWRDEDPDPVTRAELDQLLDGPGGPDIPALRDRFGDRLQFGTAGLRGELGAGPNRMNCVVVTRATAGLARYLTDNGHAGEAVIVGYDARHRSADFAAAAAAVFAGAGFRVWRADRPLPTPVLAFGVRHHRCCAGVQITASHNPPQDNGYKVYLGDGAQIVPPVDTQISDRIAGVGPLAGVPLAEAGDPLIGRIGRDLVDAYVSAAVGVMVEPEARELRVVYTPLHGVGGEVLAQAFARAGFPPPIAVPEQIVPDPDFPTVSFPNPEEPGALDLALALADREHADLVVANDPDADRLAVALPAVTDAGRGKGGAATRWRSLTGDEIGVVLADWLLAHGSGPDRLVVTTVVSSSMLRKLAAARGVDYAETLTGFKWIARAALDRPHRRFVYGYEEALGSCVGTLVRDKDGITAALAFAELTAFEKSRGRTVQDRLDDLTRELGVHATAQRSIRIEGVGGDERMRAMVDRLATAPPATLLGRAVTQSEDLRLGGRLPPTDGLVLRADGLRLIVRPSGTEPKLKCYAEAVIPVIGGRGSAHLQAARREGQATVDALLGEAVGLLSN